MRKKLTSLMLCLAMLAGSALMLASCADETKTPPVTTTPGGNTEVMTLDKLPQVDMEEAVINFAIAETDGDGFHLRSIKPDDEESEDNVDMTVFARNERIQQYFNCVIEVAHYDNNSLNAAIGAQLTAGEEGYDILAARQYDDVQLALRGVVYDLNMLTVDYPEAAGYLNMDADYWAKSYNDALQIGTGRYWVTGDLCLRYSGGYYCYFVNHTLYNEKLAEKYGNVYDLVRDGKWSLDLLAEMAPALWEDLDGSEKTDSGDVLSIAQPVWDNANGLSISSGVVYSYRYEDGTIDLTFVHGNTAIEKFMKSFNALLKCDGVYDFGGDYAGAMNKLVANEATFASGRLNQAELYLRDMDDNYGILPNPKLSADQENYISSIHDGVQLYGINNSCTQIPYAVLVLEAMEIESRRTVRPAYFESSVKIKYSRGSDDADMIDLMDATIYSDFVYVWQFSAEMKGLGDWMRNNVKTAQGYNGVKRQQEAWKKGLADIMEAIKTLEQNSAV
ncbi:MAG: hypothetical protein J6R82_00615 [Clostridia bacterium]|nr:hypothetical protein [Clostridia bacterium]